MPQIAEWLKKIVAAIILAGFLEMMLPNNEFKNVTRMMMGLVIMSILLQPMIRFFDLPEQIGLSLPAVASSDSSKTRQIIAKGLKMRNEWTREAQEKNKRALELKLKNIIGLIDEVQLDGLQLQYQGEELNRAYVKLKSTKIPKDSGVMGKIRRKIIDAVQFVTDLREDQIEVNWDGR